PAALLVSWAFEGAAAQRDAQDGSAAYVIDTASSSTDGRDGQWREELRVERSAWRQLAHVIEFDGQRWVRVRFGRAGAASITRFDLHDASDGTDDCWLL